MGYAAIPYVLMAAAAATTAYNTHRTAKRQDQAAAEGIRRQSEEQRKANQRLNETLDFFEESDAGDLREKLSSRYANQIRLKQQQALHGLDTPGGGSSAYDAKSDRVSGQVLDRADVLKDLFSRIDAPVDQRLLEGYERQDLGSDLSLFSRNSAAEDYLTRLRVASKQRSPWLDIIAAGLSGAASGMSGGGGAGAIMPSSTGATIAGSGGQSPQIFYNPNVARTPVKATPGSIFGTY